MGANSTLKATGLINLDEVDRSLAIWATVKIDPVLYPPPAVEINRVTMERNIGNDRVFLVGGLLERLDRMLRLLLGMERMVYTTG
jgi:hypothetical protein